MNAKEIRKGFKDFFAEKGHVVVDSAPMVIKNDPTLMFTNAGMNQFKEIFLGHSPIKHPRVANSQKCLRVSGKHNDLEEVGHDTYHHTMFEMLGNWSFGDYFKAESIDWAWELLVNRFKLKPERMYATVFMGDQTDGVELDTEAQTLWLKYLPANHILLGNKKDNFWEMGASGPCGPCSEIHIDLRPEAERAKIPGSELVNKDHPQVIEIWNLVFIQYNRKADGKLESLPQKHVDTGMGFERLCMAMHGKTSNYDTDVFQPIIQSISKISGIAYGAARETDVAMRVIADHIRTVSFSITDGQLPSNNKAGYVIKRILRRAVRYGYTFLNMKEPFMYKLIPALIDTMGDAYPELLAQKSIIEKVMAEEEASFLKTLSTGIKLLDQRIAQAIEQGKNEVSGKVAFELYDTFGFPFDLTQLILKEKGLTVSQSEFELEMEEQKNRSRSAAVLETGDWTELVADDYQEFVGYDYLDTEIKITKYRQVKEKGDTLYQLVFNVTPFYAEGGGQHGDAGFIEANGQKITILNVKREHNQTVHIVKQLPTDLTAGYKAMVDAQKRKATERNHTATHLLHQALREVLGTHVEQKGSLVTDQYLRFDFSHYQKVTDEELVKVEHLVNERVRANYTLCEHRQMPITQAQQMGAMALFGEKYGDTVRVIQFNDSVELCGGTHVKATGEIGFVKITSESSIAAGIRRIEAITGAEAETFINAQLLLLKEISTLLKGNRNIVGELTQLIQDKSELGQQIEGFEKKLIKAVKDDLIARMHQVEGINIIISRIEMGKPERIKDLAFQLKGEFNNLVFVVGAELDGKANLAVLVSDNLVTEKGWNAAQIIREISKEVQGGGGGQPFFATAGGKNPAGIDNALNKAREILGL
jgi:alanyl-tRNA synthetase